MPGSRLAVAIGTAAAIVLAAPYIGQIRSVLQASLPAGVFLLVVGGVVAASVAAAVFAALVRIRERRRLRYGLLALGFVIGIGYAIATRTGNASVDAVERFHLVQYGALTLLFYRVWRPLEDRATLAAPVLAALIVAVLDEATQWFVPLRVGEIRDVLLDGVAILCGLLFALGLDPPRSIARTFAPHSAGTRLLPAAALLACALFVDVVHLGRELSADALTFRSRYGVDELVRLSADRRARWAAEGPPVAIRRLSREDQYLAEGLWHVQRRNEAMEEADPAQAWRENQVLERFFAPVLDHPSYMVPGVSRWTGEQRADVQARAGDTVTPMRSTAEPFPIVTWNRPMFRLATIVTTLACLVLFVRRTARRVPQGDREPV